jgi:hypothetical protein
MITIFVEPISHCDQSFILPKNKKDHISPSQGRRKADTMREIHTGTKEKNGAEGA